MTADAIRICRWTDLRADPEAAHWRDGITAIFREAATAWPADPDLAAAFSELWLNSYLREEPDLAFVALDQRSAESRASSARIVGYLVGATADPRRGQRFASLGYFADFAAELTAYPAQLHVNVAASCRGQGIGERLVEALAATLQAQSCPGVHIVTAAGSRNIGFYRRCGFAERQRTHWNGRELVFMGRALAHVASPPI